MIISLLIGILLIVAWWMVFNKAGQPGWAIIIPIYNVLVILNVAQKPWWWIFLFLIPIVQIIFIIMALHAISLNFGKGAGFTVGMIFLPFIFIPILAFGDASYAVANAEVKPEEKPAEPAAEESEEKTEE